MAPTLTRRAGVHPTAGARPGTIEAANRGVFASDLVTAVAVLFVEKHLEFE